MKGDSIRRADERSGIRRADFHDYSRPGYYLITLVSLDRVPLFGSLIDEQPASPYIRLSPLGLRVDSEEAKVIHRVYPMVDVKNFTVMPDHIHMILRVRENFPEGKSIGNLVNGFKTGCRHAYRDLFGKSYNIFDLGYNDRILFSYTQLQRWYHYLDDNPRRLAIKRRMPELFRVRRNIPVNGRNCDAVGNMFLLDIPDKRAVIVHRKDTDEEFKAMKKKWLDFAEAGGVLVSAAISPREKIVMREAIDRGYSMIIVRNEGMSRFYKPAGEAFDACASGRMLQITPFPDNYSMERITRRECLFLNDFASGIADTAATVSMAAMICDC